jgi:predicted phosphodiesterase
VNDDLQNILKENKYNIILNGHSHRHMIKRIEHFTIINAGTLMGHEPCFMIIDFKTMILKCDIFLKNIK